MSLPVVFTSSSVTLDWTVPSAQGATPVFAYTIAVATATPAGSPISSTSFIQCVHVCACVVGRWDPVGLPILGLCVLLSRPVCFVEID